MRTERSSVISTTTISKLSSILTVSTGCSHHKRCIFSAQKPTTKDPSTKKQCAAEQLSSPLLSPTLSHMSSLYQDTYLSTTNPTLKLPDPKMGLVVTDQIIPPRKTLYGASFEGTGEGSISVFRNLVGCCEGWVLRMGRHDDGRWEMLELRVFVLGVRTVKWRSGGEDE